MEDEHDDRGEAADRIAGDEGVEAVGPSHLARAVGCSSTAQQDATKRSRVGSRRPARIGACRRQSRSARRCAPSSTPSCAARSSSSTWCARSSCATTAHVDVIVSLTTPGCPIRNHFQTAVAVVGRRLDGVTGVGVTFDVLADTEKAALQRKLGRTSLPEGALAEVTNVICVGSGKGGVGKSTLTVNLAAALAAEGKTRRRARRRRLGLLDPAHARPRRRAAARLGGAQDHPARGPRREGDVDRLLRRGGRGRRLARADAPQGARRSSSRTSPGASSTTCSSTCRRAPATSR